MGGEPKVGKSLLVANPALALASGKDRAGFTVPAVRLKIDCDVTLTEVASGLYRMLGRRIAGYESAHSRQLFRHFLNTPAEVEITGNRVAVRLPPRCGGVTECDRKVTLHATQARHRAIGAAMLQQCQGRPRKTGIHAKSLVLPAEKLADLGPRAPPASVCQYRVQSGSLEW
jgi:hypothetical protein